MVFGSFGSLEYMVLGIFGSLEYLVFGRIDVVVLRTWLRPDVTIFDWFGLVWFIFQIFVLFLYSSGSREVS